MSQRRHGQYNVEQSVRSASNQGPRCIPGTGGRQADGRAGERAEGQGWLEGWATVEGRNLPIHTYKDFTASTSPETFDLFKTIRLHMLKI